MANGKITSIVLLRHKKGKTGNFYTRRACFVPSIFHEAKSTYETDFRLVGGRPVNKPAPAEVLWK